MGLRAALAVAIVAAICLTLVGLQAPRETDGFLQQQPYILQSLAADGGSYTGEEAATTAPYQAHPCGIVYGVPCGPANISPVMMDGGYLQQEISQINSLVQSQCVPFLSVSCTTVL